MNREGQEVFFPAEIIEALLECNVNFIVHGGYAIVLHGSPTYYTSDIDIIASTTPENIANLCEALNSLGAAELGTWISPITPKMFPDEPEEMKDFYQFITEYGDIDVIIHAPPAGDYENIIRSSVHKPFGKYILPVSSLDTLEQTKKEANRPKDIRGLNAIEDLKSSE